MTGALLKTVMKAGVYFGISEILLKGKKSEYRIQNIVIGIILLLLAGWVGFLGVAAVLGAIFFGIADVDQYIRPILIAALAAFAVALVLAWEGIRRIKMKAHIHPLRR